METKAEAPPSDTAATARSKLINNLKSSNQKTRREAAEELSGSVNTDPEAVATLLELLKDKTTTGLGKILPTQINSTREAAARALLAGGPKGEDALKDKGFAILRDGLNDPQPAIREHTAYTIGRLGPLARPLSPDVMKLCVNSDENIRGRAFDALGSIGVTDVPGFAELLNHENREVGKLAAELIPTFMDIPSAAIPPLTVALGSEEASIRTGAAAGLVIAGPKAAAAASALTEAIKKHYTTKFDLNVPYEPGSEMVFWQALVKIGEPAVAPTADLLTYANPIVRAYAAKTLGEIGAPSKPAADKLKAALKDTTIVNVPIEAACALCIIGEGKDDAVQLVKQAMEQPTFAAQIAIEVIPRMGEAGKPLIPIAVGKLGSENPFARFAAVGLVGTLPPAEATTFAAELGKLATDRVPEIRYRVGLVLEKLGKAAAPAADALGKALGEEKVETIRDQFFDALIAMGPGAKPALPTLMPLTQEKSLPPLRRIRVIAAIAAADPTSKEVMTALIVAADDKEEAIRTASATALGKLDPLPPEALAKLVALAKSDARSNPRLAAIRALALAAPRAKSARGEIEAIAAGPQPGLALWAKVGLAKMDGDITKTSAAIRAALTDRIYPARAAAAEILLLIGPAMSDLPVLIKLLKDTDSNTRQAAARCIGFLGPKAKEAIPQLLSLLNDNFTEVRIAAVEALGEMGTAGLSAVEKLKALRGDLLVEFAARKALEKLGVSDKK
jgi:HEAT repeat protein